MNVSLFIFGAYVFISGQCILEIKILKISLKKQQDDQCINHENKCTFFLSSHLTISSFQYSTTIFCQTSSFLPAFLPLHTSSSCTKTSHFPLEVPNHEQLYHLSVHSPRYGLYTQQPPSFLQMLPSYVLLPSQSLIHVFL